MKKNKLTIIAIILLCFISTLNAQEIKPKSVRDPIKDHVILVGRVVYKNPIDHEARKPADPKLEKYFTKADSVSIRHSKSATTFKAGEIGEPFFLLTPKKNKTNKVDMYGFDVKLFSRAAYRFFCPVFSTITVPEGAKYLYVGTFEYDFDYALRVKSVNHYDEYDQACEWIKIATGRDDVELIRAELEPLEEEKKD